jgi:hypothetical protein
MPWRRRPRAAFFLLLGATALIAAAAGLRAPKPSPQRLLDRTLSRDAAGCAGVNPEVWHPLSGIDYTGRLHVTLPARFGGAIAFYVGDALPLDIEALDDHGEPIAIHQERLVAGPGVLVPPDFWLEDGSPTDAPHHISRLTIDAAGGGPRAFTLSLGRRAPRVLARLVNYPAGARAAVCAEPVGVDEIYFATGWYGQESEPTEGPVRWMRQQGALLVQSTEGRAARVHVRLAPATFNDLETTELRVRVNDMHDLPPVALAARFAEYDLAVPDRAWAVGANELLFSVSRTRTVGSRVRGLALASLHVR